MAARLPDIGTYTGHPMLGVTLPPPPPPPLPPLPPPPPPPPPPSSFIIDGTSAPQYIYQAHFPHVIQGDPYVTNNKNHLASSDSGNPYCLLPSLIGFKRPNQIDNANPAKKVKSETEDIVTNTNPSCSTDKDDPGNASEASKKKKQAPGDVFQCIRDTSFPKELTKLFGALKCDLCSVTVNSTVQARMHYIGKQHEKKVNSFLIKWCKETGQPMPNVSPGPAKTKKPANPEELFCKVCNIALTSLQHAQQHYMGRNHMRVLNGHTPLKPGYFNKETGKWQRLPQIEKHDPTGRFGIGVAFLPDPSMTFVPEVEASTSSIINDVKSPSKNRRFFCELCQIATTSQDQLDMHWKGAKHRKAERIAITTGNNSQPIQSNNIPLPSTPTDSILASVMKTNKNDKSKSGIKDYSIYRTPSGQFYCQPCNLTLNSESQFSQHCDSRKHKLAIVKKPVNKGAGRSNLNLK